MAKRPTGVGKGKKTSPHKTKKTTGNQSRNASKEKEEITFFF
jgi:hypothetical protein